MTVNFGKDLTINQGLMLSAYFRKHFDEIKIRADMGNGPARRLMRRASEIQASLRGERPGVMGYQYHDKFMEAIALYRACQEN